MSKAMDEALAAVINAQKEAVAAFAAKHRSLNNRRTAIILLPGPVTPEQQVELDAIHEAILALLAASDEYNLNVLQFLDSAASVMALADKAEVANKALRTALEKVNGIIKRLGDIEAFLKTANSFLTAIIKLKSVFVPLV